MNIMHAIPVMLIVWAALQPAFSVCSPTADN